MSEVLLFTVLTLCIVGVLAAVVLYFVAQKFKVYEDPRIDAVESMLPGANCGGCGYPGAGSREDGDKACKIRKYQSGGSGPSHRGALSGTAADAVSGRKTGGRDDPRGV